MTATRICGVSVVNLARRLSQKKISNPTHVSPYTSAEIVSCFYNPLIQHKSWSHQLRQSDIDAQQQCEDQIWQSVGVSHLGLVQRDSRSR